MNDQNFSDDKFRPTAFGERPRYRFEEDEAGLHHPLTPYQSGPPENSLPYVDRAKDEKHLDQLSLGFKIYAAINALFSCFPFIHLFMGIMMVTGKMDDGVNAPPPFFGWFFIIFAAAFILTGWAISACNYYAGKFLKERRNYTFCFVMSCINCTFMPLGTILGIFGIIVLVRDSVKNLFQENRK